MVMIDLIGLLIILNFYKGDIFKSFCFKYIESYNLDKLFDFKVIK